jgi:molybdopterin converting factor small subunit
MLVNGGDATPDRTLHPGDVVAVFPPLAGGHR